MGIKVLLLLSGVTAFICAAPAAWAKDPDRQDGGATRDVTHLVQLPAESGKGQFQPNREQLKKSPFFKRGAISTSQKSSEISPDTSGISSAMLPEPAAVIAGSTSLNTGERIAPTPEEQINVGNKVENFATDAMEQVTSVSQLSDVQPTDWAFQALQNLVERYGCVAGYPDGTFRGNRAMTRYEFAAGLNACIDKINQLIASKTPDLSDKVTKQDLTVLQQLQEQFASELATVANRVTSLEARTSELEANRFTNSSTVFGGEVILGLSKPRGGAPPGDGNNNAVFTQLTRLQTATTFTGKDLLRIELAAGNFSGRGFAEPSVLNTYTALLSFQADTGNQFQLSALDYRFPAFNDRVVFTIRPAGFSLSSVLTANSPFFDNGRGAISRFGEANAIFKIGDLDAGIGMDWLLSRGLRLQLAYGARNGSDSGQGFVFGKDTWVAGGELLLLLGNNALANLTAIYGSSPNGRLNTFTGSGAADASGFINQRSNIYALGAGLQWRISPKFHFATWGGVAATYAEKTDAFAASTTWAASLGFPDIFGRRGDLLGIIVGQPLSLVEYDDFSASTGLPGGDAFSLHLEAFYRFKVSDNLSITPGFFLVTHPGNYEDNNTIYVGTVRTTFRF